MKHLLKIAMIFFVAGNAWADGGWTSGGGELLKDSRNPWFLKNTKQVFYCIQIDNENFGAELPQIRSSINKAVSFWKSEFKDSLANKELGIAIQDFIEVSCENKTDIVFQFGILSKDQRAYLGDPSSFGAITIRTDYDRKTLRGKGFVYVSPSRGSLAYNPQGVMADAWKKKEGEFLYLTLVHELGHVFGIPHMGSYGELMSEDFVEAMLEFPEDKYVSMAPHLRFFSLPKGTNAFCYEGPGSVYDFIRNRWKDLMKLKAPENCFQVRFNFAPNNTNLVLGKLKLEVWAGPKVDQTSTLIAEGELEMANYTPEYISTIWLSKDQDIFSSSDLISGTVRLPGIALFNFGASGVLKFPGSSGQRGMRVRFIQGSLKIHFEVVDDNGQIITLI